MSCAVSRRAILYRAFTASLIAAIPAGCAFLQGEFADSSLAVDERLSERTLLVGGRMWTYHEYGPSASAGSPVVILLHGSGGAGDEALIGDGWLETAEAAGLKVVAPDAPPLRPDRRANVLTNPRMWNVGPVVEGTERAAIDDLAFFEVLFDTIGGESSGTIRPVFVVGHSGGASMAFRLARERPERIAAIVAVAGLYWEDGGGPTEGVPTLFITGEDDPLVPLDGGSQGLFWLERTTPPVRESLAYWATAIGCSDETDIVFPDVLGITSTSVRAEKYAACADAEFVAVFIAGHGHRWPAGRSPGLPDAIIGPSRNDVSATELAVTFFARHAVALSR